MIIFSYIPMTGVILAFKQYQYKGGNLSFSVDWTSEFQIADDCWKVRHGNSQHTLYNIALFCLVLYLRWEVQFF